MLPKRLFWVCLCALMLHCCIANSCLELKDGKAMFAGEKCAKFNVNTTSDSYNVSFSVDPSFNGNSPMKFDIGGCVDGSGSLISVVGPAFFKFGTNKIVNFPAMLMVNSSGFSFTDQNGDSYQKYCSVSFDKIGSGFNTSFFLVFDRQIKGLKMEFNKPVEKAESVKAGLSLGLILGISVPGVAILISSVLGGIFYSVRRRRKQDQLEGVVVETSKGSKDKTSKDSDEKTPKGAKKEKTAKEETPKADKKKESTVAKSNGPRKATTEAERVKRDPFTPIGIDNWNTSIDPDSTKHPLVMAGFVYNSDRDRVMQMYHSKPPTLRDESDILFFYKNAEKMVRETAFGEKLHNRMVKIVYNLAPIIFLIEERREEADKIVTVKSSEADKTLVTAKSSEADKTLVTAKSSEADADKALVTAKSSEADKTLVTAKSSEADADKALVTAKSKKDVHSG